MVWMSPASSMVRSRSGRASQPDESARDEDESRRARPEYRVAASGRALTDVR